MADKNLALNKTTASSSFVKPYDSSKAVNGSLAATSRWLCNVLPGSMEIDLGQAYLINRWVVKQMGCAGWDNSYNLVDYKLSGSMDRQNWLDIDTCTNNTQSITDRKFLDVQYRYVRLYVTTGLRVNPKLASLMELEIYGTPTLANLAVSTGVLQPVFASNIDTYSDNIGYDINSMTVTPSTNCQTATITVNNQVVVNGAPSQSIPLTVGQNVISTVVNDNNLGSSQYNINAVRASSPYLSGIIVSGVRSLDSPFSKIDYEYRATVANTVTSVTIKPTAEDSNALIKVNGVGVISGNTSGSIPLVVGDNTSTIDVNSSIGTDYRAYTVIITRRSS